MKSISQLTVTFILHDKSAEIKLSSGRVFASKTGQYARGAIQDFSWRSERRMRLALEDNRHLWKYFIMLSYPGEFPWDGRKVKRDIQAMKRWLKRQGVTDIFWGIEFQKRGAPHINILIPERIDKDKLKKAWYRIVGSGDPRHLRAGSGIQKVRSRDGMATYMVGYVNKAEQKDVPAEYKNVGRFWGCTRSDKIAGTYTYRFATLKELESFMNPVVNEYQANIKAWGEKKGKEYTWKYKGKSFVMWSGAEFINNLIQGEKRDEQEERKEKKEVNKQVNERAQEQRCADGNDQRKLYRINPAVTFQRRCRKKL